MGVARQGEGFGFSDLANIETCIRRAVSSFVQSGAHRRVGCFQLRAAVQAYADAGRVENGLAGKQSEITAGQQGRQQRHIRHTGSKQAHRIEGRGKVLHAGCGEKAETGLVTGDAAERCRPQYGAAGLGADGCRNHTRGDSGSRSGGRAAGGMGMIVRVDGWRRFEESELGGRGLADDGRALSARQIDDGRIDAGAVAFVGG